MIGPEDENVRPHAGAGFGEAVTLAFGDPDSELYGIARLGLAGAGPASASVLAVLFAGREIVAAETNGGIDVDAPQWQDLEVGGVRHAIHQPLAAWRVAFEGGSGGFDLSFRAVSEPAAYEVDGDGGTLAGYDQLCRVEGAVRIDGATREVRCLGQRGRSWGEPLWEHIALARSVSVWLEDEQAVAITSLRTEGAPGQEGEQVRAFAIDGDRRPPAALDEARVSTAFDGEGRQRRAGLELWPAPDADYPLRAAGEAVCGTSLDLGRLRMDCAFFTWRMEGRTGVGRYETVRRA